jgi:hypothetical protein
MLVVLMEKALYGCRSVLVMEGDYQRLSRFQGESKMVRVNDTQILKGRSARKLTNGLGILLALEKMPAALRN